MNILITIALIIIGVLLFELIIFSHELGHFITAKLSGVKVNEFALGMGPKIFGFTKGETQYSLRLFPIGGYCAMEGEDDESPEPRAFTNAKVWKRMIIIIAGAVMNIILGFLLMFVYTVQSDSYASTTIDGFVPNSYSANCGLQAGDKIININGYSIWNYQDLSFAIATLSCKEVDGTTFEVYKEDAAVAAYNTYVDVVKDYNLNDEKSAELYDVVQDGCSKINMSTAQKDAEQYLHETVSDIYGYVGKTDFEYPEITQQTQRKRFTGNVTVIRNGNEIKLDDVQFFTYYQTQEDKENDKPSVAIDFYVEEIPKTFGSVLSQTLTQTGSMVKTVWTSLVWLVQGRFSFSDLSGPVGIASAVTQVAAQGLSVNFGAAVNNILYVMILITVNLGIVNMLPFPALDGGRFVFLLIEGIFKKPVPRKAEAIVNAAGLVLLMILMVVITFKDIWQLITGTMPGM